jgi:tetratricopeptide (TPR) repeat protein
MEEHPTPQILKDLLRGRLTSGDTRTVIAHLATDCPKCREEIAPTAAAMFRPGRVAPVSSSEEEDLYDAAIDSACKAALKFQRSLENERAEADSKIAKLLRDESFRKTAKLWTWGLCERLLERSWDLRQKNPTKMLKLAQYAVEAAENIDSRQYGAQHVADLLARSWAGLANAYRVSDQLTLAENAFRHAFKARSQGTRSPLLQARLAELSASLLCDQRQFPEAFQLLDFAHRTFLKHRALHDAGRALIQRGVHTGWSGDPEEGIRIIAQGLRLIERGRDPKLGFQSLHSILIFRVELGEFKLARRQIWEMRPLYYRHREHILQVKLRWIEGKVFLGLGQIDRAVRAFQQAQESFLQKRMNYDAALVSFDLAAVWLRQRKLADVRLLLQEMLDIFRARYIAREGIAALIMLRDAANRNELTFDLLEHVTMLFEVLKGEPKPEGGEIG